jgi:RES domain-containing protein
MITCWRIVKKRWVASALSGEGAMKSPGRWNGPGVAMVYASSSISLAIHEIIVHLSDFGEWVFRDFCAIEIKFDESLVEIPNSLPETWRNDPYSDEAREFGNRWIHEQRSLALRVPSALIPLENNYLMNPSHPAIISIEKPNIITLDLDPRLFKFIPATRTR